ncbi:MAG: hypothetical protein F4X36_08810 [Gammaproteobacteria bacterium]|nr:hypothetical protein [Gammaproteobacteria bacterium]
MLFKKTLKVASATALWMVALLGANSAMATINLDGTPAANTMNATAAVTFSLETIEAGDNISAAGQPKFYMVTAANATDLAVTRTLGIYHLVVDENTNLYLRYDFNEHLKLRTTAGLENADVTVAGGAGSPTVALESTVASDPFVLVQVDGTPDAEAVVTVNFQDSLATSGRGNGTVRIRAYESPVDAISGRDNALFDQSATLVKVARSVSVTVNSAIATADVETGFTKFIPDSNPTRLGYFSIGINAMHLDSTTGVALGMVAADAASGTEDASANPGLLHDGLSGGVNTLFEQLGIKTNMTDTVTLADARGGHGKTTVSGDGGFAFGTPSFCNNPGGPVMGSPGADDPAVSHPLAFAPTDMETKAGPVTGGIAYLPWYLCFDVKATNTAVIPEGNYYLTMEFGVPSGELLERRPFPPANVTNAMIGQIRHNGTTVHIPYVTTFENYTQRLVIVNRNKTDVEYAVMFNTEEGGTADPMMHSGMLMGGQTMVLKMDELTTLENPTRASATLTVVSHPRNVDVATTIVNKMDEATDTVVLHRGLHDM